MAKFSKRDEKINAIGTKSYIVHMARWDHERRRGDRKRPRLAGRRQHYDAIRWAESYGKYGTFSEGAK